MKRSYCLLLLFIIPMLLVSAVGCVDETGYLLPDGKIVTETEYTNLPVEVQETALAVEYAALDPDLADKAQVYSGAVKRSVDAGNASGLIPQPYGLIGSGILGVIGTVAGFLRAFRFQKKAGTVQQQLCRAEGVLNLTNHTLGATVNAIEEFKKKAREGDNENDVEAWDKLKVELAQAQDHDSKQQIAEIKNTA